MTSRATTRVGGRRLAILAVILAEIAVVVGLLLVRARDASSGGDGGARQVGPDAPAGVGIAADDAAAGAVSSRAGIAITAYRGEPLEGDSAETAVLPPPADGVEVDVVMRDGGAPVAGAVVSIVDRGRIDEFAYDRILMDGNADGVFARLAGRYRADVDGVARVPSAAGVTRMQARKGELAGWVDLAAGEPPPYRIEIEPEHVARVLVVDAAGEPAAGVPVALSLLWPTGHEVVATASTAADGRATFADVAHAARVAEDKAWPDPPVLRVGLAFPLLQPVSCAIDLAHLPREAVRLVLPPTGRVVINVRAPEVALHRRYVVVMQACGQAGTFADDVGFRDGRRVYPHGFGPPDEALEYRTECDGGASVTLPFVGLEQHLSCRVIGQEKWDFWRGDFDGPARAGESVDRTIEVSDRYERVTSRVLGPDGEPLASERVVLRVVATSGVMYTPAKTAMTDGEGRMTLRHPASDRDTPEDVVLEVDWIDGTGTTRAAARSLPMRLSLETATDAGDLQLEAVELVVAGVVVDDAGVGLAGADVRVRAWRQSGGTDVDGSWVDVDTFPDRVMTDVAGHFVFRGRTPDTCFLLGASKSGFVCDEARVCPLGTTDTRVVLTRAGEVEGSLLLPPDTAANVRLLTVWVLMDGRPAAMDWEYARATGWAQWGEVSPQGRFRFRPLRPGTATVMVYIAGANKPLATVTGVVVNPGETTRNVRLQPVDVLAGVHTFRVRVFGPDGQLAPGSSVTATEPGEEGIEDGWHFTECVPGEVIVTVPSLPVNLMVLATDMLARRVTGISTAVDVSLAASQWIAVDLPPDVWAPGPRFLIMGHLERESMDPEWPEGDGRGSGFPPGSARLSLELPRSGRRTVVFSLRDEDSRRTRAFGRPLQVDVLPGVAVTHVMLPVSAAEIAAAVEALNKP